MFPKLITTFPPILLSTCATSVVGNCRSSIPLLKVAAANPAVSPITPPPNAIKRSLR